MSTIKSDNFDSATPPAFPAGWIANASLTTQVTHFNSAPNGVGNSAHGVTIQTAYWDTDDDGNGGDAQSSIVAVPSSRSNVCAIYALCRMTVPSTTTAGITGYFFTVDFLAGTATLGRFNAGTFNTLATMSAAPTATGANYRVYCVCVGTQITGRVLRISDSEWMDSGGVFHATLQDVLTFADTGGSAISGVGKAGFGINQSVAGDVMSADDFLFENTVSAAQVTRIASEVALNPLHIAQVTQVVSEVALNPVHTAQVTRIAVEVALNPNAVSRRMATSTFI